MILTRTPFRASLAGGGSDLKDFYSKNGFGAVVSTAIDKYMYIAIHPYFHDKIRLKYSKTEDVHSIDDIEHPIIREALRKVKIETGIEIASFADVPAGTGLGSSSAFTVGLLNALYTYKCQAVSKEQLAREACEIEIDILGEPIGKQDQYAASYGNINYIKFNSDETVEISPIFLTKSKKKEIENSFRLYHVGGKRRARDILSEQVKNISDNKHYQNLKNMVKQAAELRDTIYQNNLDDIGHILHKGWLLKKELAGGISNEYVDDLYEKALRFGADGGKLLGAGSNGFFLLYSKNHVNLSMNLGCKVLPFRIDREGTKIIYYD